ncbi:MAG: undecaprenyl/decaprenyl-phosphate alpha-N-acetylglucosaminyl 1-phosphate transferase [Candidatus Moranbacteria bacterium]|nr:undecaprenyl/decaprenyl-phosphate alpha-N-acetylglucosaminyl 1-phosphate transferase [Candidatus Moranbacteria bacterium]
MDHSLFLMPLLISCLISTFLLLILIVVGRRCSILESRISKRHLHKIGTLRFGGVALILSFVATILLDKNLIISTPLMGVLFASLAILILGVVDDFKQISWKLQLCFQFFIVIFVYGMGVKLEYMSNPFGGILLFQTGLGSLIGLFICVAWVIFLMNALNWVDGVDGVAGGITLIGVVTIFVLSLRPEVNQPPIGIITAALMGGLLAFILLNFNPAKIMAGTSGSIFMGFMLAIMAIFAGAKIATTLLVLAVPVIDALWVIIERFRAGASIFSADRRHLHFRLLELGWSVKRICLFYYVITILVALVSLNTGALGKAVTFVLISLIMVSTFVFISKKIETKELSLS